MSFTPEASIANPQALPGPAPAVSAFPPALGEPVECQQARARSPGDSDPALAELRQRCVAKGGRL
jgi:hypothetical protein